MCNVKLIKSADMFPVIYEILESGQHVRLTVTGMSMYPFLHENADDVELQKVHCEAVRRGDIVLYLRNNGEYVLHRVQRKEEGQFYLIGDNQQYIEGPIRSDQLIASVSAVFRNGKRIDCDGIRWRALSWLWLKLIPIRGKVNHILRKAGV